MKLEIGVKQQILDDHLIQRNMMQQQQSTIKMSHILFKSAFQPIYGTTKITKEEFVNELILSNDVADFYNPREQKLLSLDFDFEEMKADFEKWMIENCDNK